VGEVTEPAADESAMVIACQGPPRCELEWEDAIAAMKAGCVWCRRITICDDGSEAEAGPCEALQ